MSDLMRCPDIISLCCWLETECRQWKLPADVHYIKLEFDLTFSICMFWVSAFENYTQCPALLIIIRVILCLEGHSGCKWIYSWFTYWPEDICWNLSKVELVNWGSLKNSSYGASTPDWRSVKFLHDRTSLDFLIPLRLPFHVFWLRRNSLRPGSFFGIFVDVVSVVRNRCDNCHFVVLTCIVHNESNRLCLLENWVHICARYRACKLQLVGLSRMRQVS